MKFLERLSGPARRGVRANLRPGLFLQAFALLLLVSYFGSSEVKSALDRLGELKQQGGYLFSGFSTALFGGVIPFAVLSLSGHVPRQRAGSVFLFYFGFWFWKGAEVDGLYRAQAAAFGDENAPLVVLSKVLVDQFVYNPLWGAPSQTLCFLWKDAGFSVSATSRELARQSLIFRSAVVLVSTWVVWIPAVAIIYSLPQPLQVPLFNLVLCFWSLLLSFVSREQPKDS